MNLKKAKEILELNLKLADKKMPPDVKDALALHIEASTFICLTRVTDPGSVPRLLPGETEE